MYFGYATLMVLKTAVIVISPALFDDPLVSITKTQFGAIIAYGTLGGILGKLISGWSADKYGGRITFFFGLLVTGLAVAVFGLTSKYLLFSLTFFSVSLARAFGWPSMTKLIGNWYQPFYFGRVWGAISTSSRVGTITATLSLGYLLNYVGWRTILWIASTFGMVYVLIWFFSVHENPPRRIDDPGTGGEPHRYVGHHLSNLDLKQALLVFAKSKRVWLIGGAMMGLTILTDFINFLPLFLKESLNISSGNASMVSSAFPIGAFVSVLIGGYFFDKVSKEAITRVIGVLLFGMIVSLLVIVNVSYLELSQRNSVALVVVCLFGFGFGVSPAYYIPMSIFSIKFGGPHSAFLVGLLDVIGYSASMGFSFLAGSLADQASGWSRVLHLLIGISVFTLVITVYFLHGESKVGDSI